MKELFNKIFTVITIIIGLCVSTSLFGQWETNGFKYSIIGTAFYKFNIRSVDGEILDEAIVPINDREVVLVADGDTIKTNTDNIGRFFISDIKSSQVTLSIIPADGLYPFVGNFELMPGENVVIIPFHEKKSESSMMSDDTVIFTQKGDNWIYHFANQLDTEALVIDKLRQMPGVEYNKRRSQIIIPGGNVHRAYVNGAYIFGLEP